MRRTLIVAMLLASPGLTAAQTGAPPARPAATARPTTTSAEPTPAQRAALDEAAQLVDEPGTNGPTSALIRYPQTTRGDVAEEQFGVRVADPYRWLENDVRQDAQVRAWVTAQNQVTNAFLEALPERAGIRARMTQIYNFERYSVPEKAGSRYFYTRNDGLQNQSVVYVRDGLNGQPRVLIDPNTWSRDGATALAEGQPSHDGRYFAYGVQDGGTDWRTIRLLDVNTGQVMSDEIRWAKFTGIEWAKDNSGFYYSRFPEPDAARQFQSTVENQAVYFHRVGTPQSADGMVYAQPDQPRLSNNAQVSDDGRWLIVSSTEGTDPRYDIHLIDLTQPGAPPRALITGRTNDWSYLGNVGTRFFWQTNLDAPRQRIVVTDVARPELSVTELIPQREALLSSASMVGGKLILTYLNAANSEVRVFGLDGREQSQLRLAERIGTAGGFQGEQDDQETFYAFSSYNRPAAIYRYDIRTGRSTVFAQPTVAFDPANYQVSQVFYESKDHTRVPMFLVRRRDLAAGPRPTLLYAYGGFNISTQPAFSPRFLTWVDMGGVLAVANIRGGNEYGDAWHDAGRLANKQNVFDDFIAAGEYLIAQGITPRGGLAINGGSNGGLLVGAVTNQRPDLFAAAIPQVGVMDMLRFDRFTAGRYWVDDYGYPNREADFRTLWRYSPYHNIRAGVHYPPVLATTADTDDRVVPGHSFKYISAMQNADPAGAPHLIRIETRAGHGSGKPTDKQIEEYSDVLAFAAHFTGLTPMAPPARAAPAGASVPH